MVTSNGRRYTLVAVVVVLLLMLLAVASLYSYRSAAPGQPAWAILGLFGSVVLSLLPVVLLVVLVLMAARTLYRSRAPDRYDALSRLADLRDRAVLSEDEFQGEKRRILG